MIPVVLHYTTFDSLGYRRQLRIRYLPGGARRNTLIRRGWCGGTVCGYDNGQIVLFTGVDPWAAFDGLLASFGQEDLPRISVDRLGEEAFARELIERGLFTASGAPIEPLAIISDRRKKTSSVAIAIVWYAVANCIINRMPSKPLLKLNSSLLAA